MLLLGIGQGLSVVASFPFADLTRDWQPEAGVPVWTGALSIVTGMAWAFAIGTAFLGVSAGTDQLLPDVHLVEDGAKLLGALTWLAAQMIMTLRRSSPDEPDTGRDGDPVPLSGTSPSGCPSCGSPTRP